MSVSELAQMLIAEGVLLTVYTTTANGKSELNVRRGVKQDVEGVPVFYFSRYTKDHTHFAPALLWSTLIRCREFDVVHIQGWWNLVSILTVFICWCRGVKPILSPRGMLTEYSFQHRNASLKWLFHQTVGKFLLSKTVFHATSVNEERECRSIAASWRGFVLPNFVKLPVTPLKRSAAYDGLFRIGFLSRIDRKKGLEELMKGLSDFHFPFTLTIAGTGDDLYLKQLRELSKALKIDNKIQWIGWIDGHAKFEFLASIDLFALTSVNENFANVVIEALSVGTPVLISDGVGLSDYIAREALGWTTALHRESILRSLEDAHRDSAARAAIEARAPSLIYNCFTGQALAGSYIERYRNVIN